MFIAISLLLSFSGIPNYLVQARTDIETHYWQQLRKDASQEELSQFTTRVTNFQADVLMDYHRSKISGEEAFQLYKGSFSYLAAGFRKAGWDDAAIQTYEEALPLVQGTDEEVFFLMNLADLYGASDRLRGVPAKQFKALELFEQAKNLPQFLNSSRETQLQQIQIFLQMANLKAFMGETGAAIDSLQEFIDASFLHGVPLQDRDGFKQVLTYIHQKAPMKKRMDSLIAQLDDLEKASSSFPEPKNRSKKAVSALQSSNFEKFTTVQK